MKNKLRKLLLAFSFGLLFASTACELQEDVIEKHNHEHKTLVISKSFSELSLDPKFMKSYKRIPTKQAILNSISKKSVAARTEIEEEYGFTIFDAPIRVYESDTLITYNLLIESDVVEKGNYFENLIINTNPSKDITDIYKIKFFYDEGVEIVEDYLVKNPIKIILTPIYYNNHPFNEADKSSMTCIRISGLLCYDRGSNNQYSIPHEIGSDCSESQAYYGYGTVDVVCTTASGSGGGFDYSGDGGGPQDPHNGQSNGYHPVYSNPTPPCDPRLNCPALETVVGNNPCDKVNNLYTKFPSMKQSLVQLATTVSQNYENGVFIDENATSVTPNPVQTIPNNSSVGGTISINMSPPYKYVMIAHTHDAYGPYGSGTYSIFSWDDLSTINNLIKNNYIDNTDFVFFVITADNTIYALTIDNPSKLEDFFYNPSNLPQGTQIDLDKMFRMQDKFDKYYDKNKGLIKTTSDTLDDKKNFLKFMKDANLGVSLFEVDNIFTTFKKLSISAGGKVSEKPCN